MSESAPLDPEQAGEVLAEIIEDMEATIEDLLARVDLLERRDWCPWPTPSPTVAAWVNEWLVPTFRLTMILENWAEDPAIVSELTALYAGYRQMTKAKSTGWDPLTWHGHLASTCDRIRTIRNSYGASRSQKADDFYNMGG